MEEEQIFPLLGNEHELVKKALAEHRRLHRLFKLKEDTEKKLSLIEEDLDNHIRFEERILFNKIQEVAKEEELENIHAIHNDHEFKDDWEDPFWE